MKRGWYFMSGLFKLGVAILVIALIPAAVFATVTKPTDKSLVKSFDKIWDALLDLQAQILSIQLIPGPQGAPGVQGPSGPEGPPASHGAGNIAFMKVGSLETWVLLSDGTTWMHSVSYPTTTTWSQVNYPATPMPVTDVMEWDRYSLLDKNGHVWVIDFANAQWVDLGEPPQN
jgi:hypothetical protein